MSELYFNQKSNYSEANTYAIIKTFALLFLNHFQLEPEQKKMCGNESHKEETKHIHAIATDLLHIRVRNEIGANADIVKSK